MAEEDDIVQKVRVDVEGEEEAKSAFDKLKEAFESAFEKIKETVEKTDFSSTWDKLKDAGSKIFNGLKDTASSAFGRIGTAAGQVASLISQHFLAIGAVFVTLTVAVGLVARELEKLVESSLKATAALGELSDKTRTSIENVSALQSFFAQSGVSANEFQSTYRKLAATVSDTWSQIKRDAKDGSDKVIEANLAVEQATNRLEDAQRRLANTGNDLARQQASDADRVQDAQRRLEDLETRRQGLLGINTKARQHQIDVERNYQDTIRANQELENARMEQNENYSKSLDERSRRELAAIQAEQALAEARKKATEAQMNDLETITNGVNQLASGNAAALRSFNATADNIVKGIVNSASQAGAALAGLGQDFSGLSTASIPDTMIALDRLGNVLKSIPDPILRNQVAMKALGNASQDFINALQTGDLAGFVEKMKEMNSVLTESDKKIASDFTSSLSRLGDTLSLIGKRMAIAFGPSLTEAINTINDAFARSADNLIRFADDIANIVGPAINGLANVFNGLSQTLNTVLDILRNVLNILERLLGMTDIPLIKSFERLYEIAKNIAQVIGGLLGLVDGGVKKGLDGLQKESNKERQEDQDFQKQRDDREKSGVDQAPGVADTLQRFMESAQQLLDPRPLINDITEAIKNGFDTAKPIQNQTTPNQNGQQSDATGASAQQTQTAMDGVTSSAQTLASALDTVSTATDNTQQLSDQSQAAASSLSGTNEAATGAASSLNNLIGAVNAAIDALSRTPGNASVSAATGGLLSGPGTGTSDSIVARVSTGEFIQSARATKFWGVDFMRAINNLKMPKFNLGGLVANLRLPQFSVGGLVGLASPSLPRFRDGGFVDTSLSSTSIAPMPNLGTVNLTTDHGPIQVMVDKVGFSQLRRAAVMKNIGTSKKSSWVR